MAEELIWHTTSSEQLADCRVFSVHRNQSENTREGITRSHDFFYLDCGNWVNVIPVTPDGDVILIEQFRHGIASVALEVPGGIVDESDASSAVAAARELLEETGYVAEKLIFLGRNHPNPAIQNNSCDTYLALGATKQSETNFDSTEHILEKKVPLSAVSELITSGAITHALVIVAFHFLRLYEDKNGSLATNFTNSQI